MSSGCLGKLKEVRKMKIQEALREEGFAFEYERMRGEDTVDVWVNRDAKMAVRIEWLKIDEEGWRV